MLRAGLAGALMAVAGVPPEGRAASPAQDPYAGLPPPSDPDFARAVLERVDDQYRGRKSHARLSMKVHTAHYDRSLVMEAWSLGKDYSLVRILEPKKERGNATLKAGDDLFTYLAKSGRTIKITGGMMGASWMGSHFTNDDLVRESRLSEDFDIANGGLRLFEGQRVHLFRLTAKPDAAVVWQFIDVMVREQDLQPVVEIFYDEDAQEVRRMWFSDYRTLGGRTLPTVIVMRPTDKPEEYTRVEYLDLDFSPDIDASFFSLARLRTL
ncbi:MAG: outer membrane lipoprotein-sorting protein [Deltaproteobacteria bacterium]|nr:MAG: outer membrane lipoprotein-sorting protein [Deltaproteobacteria bacterium]